MKNTFKTFIGLAALIIVLSACKKQDYSMGDLTAPSNIVINAKVVGQDATHPNGDGSGDVAITVTADNALAIKVDYDATNALDLVYLPKGTTTKKYTTLGLNTYRITAVVYGKGGTSSTTTKDVSVQSNFTPDPAIVTNLTGGSSKTWVVDPSIPGHFGVGPWSNSSIVPEWWAAGVNEKVNCCNCFYTTTFTFNKVTTSNSYSLKVVCVDGAFTKTGSLTTLPGIPASGDEGCYSYGGGTSDFSFIPSSTSIAASATTKTSILLAGVNTFIGYGALQKEYEILQLTASSMYLRVQGTETGNAWYIKLKAL